MIKKIVLGVCLIGCTAHIQAHSYLFSHGFGETYRQANRYLRQYYNCLGMLRTNENYILDTPIKLFNYPDAGRPPFLFKTSFGQKNEIDALKKAYYEMLDDNIILFGVSRGAAVAVNFAGIYRPARLKALVVEAPFDHIKNVFDTHWFVNTISKVPLISKPFMFKFFLWLTKYQEDGEHPIDNVGNIRHDLPVLFMCSKADGVVPYRSTVDLYKRLVANGHPNVYLVRFETGKHAKLLQSEHGQVCRDLVHVFYEKYGLPHNPAFVTQQARDALANECQPTIEQLQREEMRAVHVQMKAFHAERNANNCCGLIR